MQHRCATPGKYNLQGATTSAVHDSNNVVDGDDACVGCTLLKLWAAATVAQLTAISIYGVRA